MHGMVAFVLCVEEAAGKCGCLDQLWPLPVHPLDQISRLNIHFEIKKNFSTHNDTSVGCEDIRFMLLLLESFSFITCPCINEG